MSDLVKVARAWAEKLGGPHLDGARIALLAGAARIEELEMVVAQYQQMMDDKWDRATAPYTARREALERDGDQWKFVAERLANSKAFDEREVIRREALEEAARVAEVYQDPRGYGDYASDVIAARIRALKEKE